ncbi:MAG: polyamine aminopropyltransferase [Bacteroidia bacterium]|nr:polyamine aminopropyltransferase [Bacteroidia bacterium]MDW8158123.1 polyamine aminopropyltransferase [Bacteroidia bacterium]
MPNFTPSISTKSTRLFSPFLLISIFIVAACSIFYELLVSTVTTYLLGSSILHFSLTIGFFMSFMGLGAYLSRFIKKELLYYFIVIEIILGLAGGASCFLLHSFFAFTDSFYILTFLLVAALGTLVGLELPLLTRIIKSFSNLRETLAKVLAFDYLGALLASILFPIIFLPFLGTMRTAFVIGLINLLIASVSILLLGKQILHAKKLLFFSLLCSGLLIAGLLYSTNLQLFFEKNLYQDEVIYLEQSKYQKIVLTRYKQDIRLYLNNHLQFSSIDEYRYHEPLVHVPLVCNPWIRKVLILGGGDGLAAKELLKNPRIDSIYLVDIDEKVTQLCKNHVLVKQINRGALENPKVKIIHKDAFKFIEETETFFDLIIADLPDPSEPSVAKLYTLEFYMLIKRVLSNKGIFVTQATSPYYAPLAFWCIQRTLQSVFDATLPYHTYVPSFGSWGFILASNSTEIKKRLEQIVTLEVEKYFSKIPTQYIKPPIWSSFFTFPQDMKIEDIDNLTVNNLDKMKLVEYYAQSWRRWNP